MGANNSSMELSNEAAAKHGCSIIGSLLVDQYGNFFEIDVDTEPIRELAVTPEKWLQDRIRKGKDYLTVKTPPPKAPKKKKMRRQENTRRGLRCARVLQFPENGVFVSPKTGRKMLDESKQKTPGAPVREWEPTKKRLLKKKPKCCRRLTFDDEPKKEKI